VKVVSVITGFLLDVFANDEHTSELFILRFELVYNKMSAAAALAGAREQTFARSLHLA